MSSPAALHLYAREQKARSARSSVDTTNSTTPAGTERSSTQEPRSSTANSTPAGTARSSTQEPRSSTEGRRGHKSNILKTAAQKALQALKEHHRSVNAAFDAVYGTSYYKKHAAAQ